MSERLVLDRTACTRKAVKGATMITAAAAAVLTVAAAPGSAATVPTAAAPTITAVTVAPNPVPLGSAPAVSAVATAAPNSTIGSATFALDGSKPIPFTLTAARSVDLRSVIDSSALTLGSHQVCVDAADTDGTAATPSCTSFRVVPPVRVTGAAVSRGGGRGRSALTLTATAIARGSRVTSAGYSLDGGPMQSINLTADAGRVYLTQVVDSAGLQPGTHRVCVSATDAAGHVSAPDCVSFAIPRGHGGGYQVNRGDGSGNTRNGHHRRHQHLRLDRWSHHRHHRHHRHDG